MVCFKNRHEAGRSLAEHLSKDSRFNKLTQAVVLGLPRGGVPVAYEVAKKLGLGLGVLVTRKLGVPGHEELAFGAIGPAGVRILDQDLMRECDITQKQVEDVVLRETNELNRRQSLYQVGQPSAMLSGGSVILVDDGIATGATMKAAAEAARKLGAIEILVAVPVGPQDARERLGSAVDIYYCLHSPAFFSSVGEWYQDFAQTSDQEVVELLQPYKQSEVSSLVPVVPVLQNQTR